MEMKYSKAIVPYAIKRLLKTLKLQFLKKKKGNSRREKRRKKGNCRSKRRKSKNKTRKDRFLLEMSEKGRLSRFCL